MIHFEKMRIAGLFLTQSERAPRYACSITKSLLTNLQFTPNRFVISLCDPVIFFGEAYSSLDTVVRELSAMCGDCDRQQLISCVPLERAGSITCEIAIRVVWERLQSDSSTLRRLGTR